MDLKHLVFVYGTLRQGFWNSFILGESERIGHGTTRERYALYVDRLPYVIRDQAVSAIVGEVYRVDTSTLADIDVLTDNPEWYRRERVPVVLESGEECLAWLHFGLSPRGQLIFSGDYAHVQPPTGRTRERRPCS